MVSTHCGHAVTIHGWATLNTEGKKKSYVVMATGVRCKCRSVLSDSPVRMCACVCVHVYVCCVCACVCVLCMCEWYSVLCMCAVYVCMCMCAVYV